MPGKATAQLLAMALAASLLAVSAAAQETITKEPLDGVGGKAAGSGRAAKPPADAKAETKSKDTAQSASGDSGLRQRIEQLEEQVLDLQVALGTVESLARSESGKGGAPRAPPAASGVSDSARIDGMETQIKALTSQLEQLAQEVHAQGGQPRRSDAGSDRGSGTGGTSSFGSTTVTSADGDPIGGLLAASPLSSGSSSPDSSASSAPPGAPASSEAQAPAAPDAGRGSSASVARAEPAAPGLSDSTNPKELYERAYGYLLQQDYASAENAFDTFLKRFPNDSLSGNAQYWLGETHFVRGQYKAAASAFLKGYETYGSNAKAPDSLLKLAMSLDRLGQKDAACSSYAELATRFPNASQTIKTRAQAERQRVGCTP